MVAGRIGLHRDVDFGAGRSSPKKARKVRVFRGGSVMAKYMLLIYGDEQSMPEPGSKAMEEEGTKYEVFTKSIVASGNFLDGDPSFRRRRRRPSRSAAARPRPAAGRWRRPSTSCSRITRFRRRMRRKRSSLHRGSLGPSTGRSRSGPWCSSTERRSLALGSRRVHGRSSEGGFQAHTVCHDRDDGSSGDGQDPHRRR